MKSYFPCFISWALFFLPNFFFFIDNWKGDGDTSSFGFGLGIYLINTRQICSWLHSMLNCSGAHPMFHVLDWEVIEITLQMTRQELFSLWCHGFCIPELVSVCQSQIGVLILEVKSHGSNLSLTNWYLYIANTKPQKPYSILTCTSQEEAISKVSEKSFSSAANLTASNNLRTKWITTQWFLLITSWSFIHSNTIN